MLVIVNPHAGRGRARAHWNRVRPELWQRIGPFEECMVPGVHTVRFRIRSALDRGERQFVAVGGDGTVNLVVRTLMELAPTDHLDQITLGAVGMGSSNDFHKPFDPASTVCGFPCRLDFAHPIRHDIGHTAYVDADGLRHGKHWVVNASVGITATGNRIYNEARGMVGIVKRFSVCLGMVVAGLAALLGSSVQTMTLRRPNGRTARAKVRNLGVVKNPHFTGCLRYDSAHEPGSGDFVVHLLNDSSLIDAIITLMRLARGRFSGRRTAHSWRGRWLALDAAQPFTVESDGETVVTRHAEFSLEPRALRICA